MKRIVSEPQSRIARRLLTAGGLLGLLLVAGAVAIGDVNSEAKRGGARQSLSLFSGPTLTLATNQVQCGLKSDGDVCTNVTNSPTAAGGAWPAGTPNAYIFNTGLQVAGIMDANAGEWANDTVGAYFFDAAGTQKTAEPYPYGEAGPAEIWNSLDPDDVANWPAGAIVQNREGVVIYDTALVGRVAASQQDSWVQYWDGNPEFSANRQHPMGILVTQRSLAWNYPAGNESILYFIYDFENITNDIENFQEPNELKFCGGANCLPDEGINMVEVYGAFGTDMDVTGDASANFSTVIYPFDLGISYHGGFNGPEFSYVPDIFFPPFFTNAPGIVGVKYLKSPADPDTGEELGLTFFTVFQNCSSPNAIFCDSTGDKQLWRYLSGKVSAAAGDQPCTVPPEIETGVPATTERSLCFITQSPSDTRFLQVSGPFTLAPGEKKTIVVAYIMAATVERMPDGSPSGIIGNTSSGANPPGIPSFHPGTPSLRGCDVNGENCSLVVTDNPVKAIERGAGWVSYNGPAPSGRGNGGVEGPENKLPLFTDPDPVTGAREPYFEVVPGSLLGRALVAQTLFDNKFLLGFAPEQPIFYLVPGNNQVTVLWEPSVTEEIGDPYIAVAGDETSALYNPNYREFDVEGYRVWRGTTPSDLQLLAQFDYANTTFTDYTCETILPDEDIHDTDPATPEGTIGYTTGQDCPFYPPSDTIPEGLGKVSGINSSLVFNNGSAGGLPGAGVVRLADSTALGLNLTTVSVDDWIGLGLTDSGIPFALNDSGVSNNFTYFYAVSAFDVNSLASGPYSLNSARVTQAVVPRNDGQNLDTATLEVFLAGASDTALVTGGSVPSINAADGTFSGPFPPTTAVDLAFVPLVERLLGEFELTARIDSVVPQQSSGSSFGTPTAECANGGDPFSSCLKMYLTINDSGELSPELLDVYNPWWNRFGEATPQVYTIVSAQVPFDEQALQDFGIPGAVGNATAVGAFNEGINNSAAESAQNRRSGASGTLSRVRHGGSRWFSGTNETIPDPTAYRSVGMVDGVDTVWAPISFTPECPGCPYDVTTGGASFEKQCFNRAMAKLGRAADVQFRWDGGLEVWDVTHDVPVMFKPTAQASYGFLTTDANGNGFIDWQDFNYIDGALQILRSVGGGNCDAAAGGSWDPGGVLTPVQLTDTPTIVPTSIAGIDDIGIADLEQTGQGFGLYIDGERYIFELDAVPTSGTWTLRTYSGTVRSDAATFDAEDPSGYQYAADFTGGGTGQLPMIVPGLTFGWRSASATSVAATTDLRNVHTVPDPYLATSQYDRSPTAKQLMFVNLPPRATIRIYTLTGVLVDQIEHDDPAGGGRAIWGLRNRNNQFVASGVYFYHVVTSEGAEKVGKFTIVNFAGQN